MPEAIYAGISEMDSAGQKIYPAALGGHARKCTEAGGWCYSCAVLNEMKTTS
jgi:hypothetical protein